MNVVVAYDIADDNRRARVAARLSAHGNRLQRSVFECIVDDSTLTELVTEIEGLLDHDTDVLHVLFQCVDCHGHRHEFGQVDHSLHELFWVI